MKKVIFAIVVLLMLASAAMAEDFSVSLQKAKPWPGKPIAGPGLVSVVAPAGKITAVKYWTRGWVTGTNSHPMTVLAYQRKTADGIWNSPAAIAGYCGNPARGGWLEPCQKAAPSVSISVSQAAPTLQAKKMVPIPEPLVFPKSEYLPSDKPTSSTSYGPEVDASVYIYKPRFVKEEEKSDTCPGKNPPADPAVGDGSTHDPSGPANPPNNNNQPPAQPDHGTGGAPWDPSPSHQNVADPVKYGSDGYPIR